MANDSYQYLSVAENVRYRHQIATSLVHFDVERSSGRLPAPSTTFPPGYSILVAIISLLGCSLRNAALILSLVSGVGIVALLWSAMRWMSIPSLFSRACLSFWVLNSYAIRSSISVSSESLFIACTLSAIVLTLAHETATEGRHWQILAAYLLAAMAYWIRYAGLFLFASLVGYGLVQAYVRKRSRAAWLGSMAAGAGIIAIGFCRNMLLTGTWRGGNTKILHKALLSVVTRGVAGAWYHLFLGDAPVHVGLVPQGLAIGMLVLLAGSVVLLGFGGTRGPASGGQVRALSVLMVYFAMYSASILYLQVTSVIQPGSPGRYVFPLLPIALLIAAVVCSLMWGPAQKWGLWFRLAGAVLLIGYGARNIESMRMHPPVSPHQRVLQSLGISMENGQPLTAWIKSNIPEQAVILAEDGQATGYALHRKTVSLVSTQFGDTVWNEGQTHEVMTAFHAEYLFVFRDPDNEDVPEHKESLFLQELANGVAPSWLVLAAENPRVRVFMYSTTNKARD
jgi:hypothetical protein